jgi:hypothetical protein
MALIFEAFPESFNELRRQLSHDHQDIWEKVSWTMVNQQELFIEVMNNELQEYLIVPYTPDMDIDTCCQGWLRALERKPEFRTCTATETIDPRSTNPNHEIKPMHRPKILNQFESGETSNMTDKQIDEAVTKGYKVH